MVSVGSLRYDLVVDTARFQKGMVVARGELRQAKKAFLETRTPAERLGLEIAELDELYRKGAITLDTYNRRLKQLKDRSNQATASMKTQTATVNTLGSSFRRMAGFAVGIFGVHQALNAVSNSLEEMDQTAKKARQLGLLTEDLIALRFAAAEMSGVASTTVDTALQRMTRRIAEAAAGSGEAKKAIEELGLSAVELNEMGPAMAFRAIADAMQGVKSQSDRVRLAFKLFDSEGAILVNTLEGGSAALEQMEQRAKSLGLVFDEETAAGVEKANDALFELKASFSGLVREFTVAIVPAIELVADSFTQLAAAIRNLGNVYKQYVRDIQNIGLSLTGSFGGGMEEIEAEHERRRKAVKEAAERLRTQERKDEQQEQEQQESLIKFSDAEPSSLRRAIDELKEVMLENAEVARKRTKEEFDIIRQIDTQRRQSQMNEKVKRENEFRQAQNARIAIRNAIQQLPEGLQPFFAEAVA